MSDVITGEAVPLELRLAKLPSRMLAFGFDAAIQLTVLFIAIGLGASVAGLNDSSLATAYTILVFVLVFIGLPTGVETLSHGRSLGKLIMGLRVVRDDGGPARFRHALVRALAAFFIDVWVLGWFGVGIFTSILSERGKRVGDYLAGTVVLRERVPKQDFAPPPEMPERLAGWAAGLQLATLPDDLALAARQYLARYHALEPNVAAAMGQRLAIEVARYIGQPIPAGVPPWAFLSAVLAERRRREIARMRTARTPGQPAYGSSPRPDAGLVFGGAATSTPTPPGTPASTPASTPPMFAEQPTRPAQPAEPTDDPFAPPA
ncbi:MAG TPA: RDD family protein [Actinomycetes bacterium]|nr:RDD family protein [Actinomycetes bacterium]